MRKGIKGKIEQMDDSQKEPFLDDSIQEQEQEHEKQEHEETPKRPKRNTRKTTKLPTANGRKKKIEVVEDDQEGRMETDIPVLSENDQSMQASIAVSYSSAPAAPILSVLASESAPPSEVDFDPLSPTKLNPSDPLTQSPGIKQNNSPSHEISPSNIKSPTKLVSPPSPDKDLDNNILDPLLDPSAQALDSTPTNDASKDSTFEKVSEQNLIEESKDDMPPIEIESRPSSPPSKSWTAPSSMFIDKLSLKVAAFENDVKEFVEGVWGRETAGVKTRALAEEFKDIKDVCFRLRHDDEKLKLQEVRRRSFKAATSCFSSMVSYWLDWIEFEKTTKSYDILETIFQTSLPKLPSLELYTSYIDYIIHVHSPQATTTYEEKLKGRETIGKAFELVLNVVGCDLESGRLWSRYIDFIKAGDAAGSYEESTKMDLLRRTFQRSVGVPHHKIEDIWREYDMFENQLSRVTAKKFIADQAASYMTARSYIKDMRSLLDPIINMRKTWLVCKPTYTVAQVQMLNYWKRYISWEQSNPLHLPLTSTAGTFWSLYDRVIYSYKSAFIDLCYFPELWLDYVEFLGMDGQGGGWKHECRETVITVLKEAVAFNPECCVLSFTLAEVLETKKVEFEVISAVFDDLLSTLEGVHTSTVAEYAAREKKLVAVLEKSNGIIDGVFTLANSNSNSRDNLDMGELREREREVRRDIALEIKARITTPLITQQQQIKRHITLVWIVYMRLTRRSQSIRAARLVFSRGRKSGLVTSYLFVASALMEFYVNKDPVVAGKIFEVGLKVFPLGGDSQEEAGDGVAYVLKYIEFLMCLNDDNNTRAMIERALAAIEGSKSRLVWEKYIDYETQYGDLNNIYTLEKRFAQVFPTRDVNSVENVERFVSKWAYFDLGVNDELGISQLSKQERIKPPAPSLAPNAHVSRVRVHGHGGKEDSRAAPLLYGVEGGGPRPDLERWTLYKCEPGQEMACRVIEIIPKDFKKFNGNLNGNANANANVNVNADRGKKDVLAGMLIPEQIADFISALPRKESYNGPTLNATELLALIFKMQIPPLKAPRMVPVPSGFSGSNLGGKRARNDDDNYGGGSRRKR